jgi:hypothetical protein
MIEKFKSVITLILTLLFEQVTELRKVLDDGPISLFLLIEHLRIIEMFYEALSAL